MPSDISVKCAQECGNCGRSMSIGARPEDGRASRGALSALVAKRNPLTGPATWRDQSPPGGGLKRGRAGRQTVPLQSFPGSFPLQNNSRRRAAANTAHGALIPSRLHAPLFPARPALRRRAISAVRAPWPSRPPGRLCDRPPRPIRVGTTCFHGSPPWPGRADSKPPEQRGTRGGRPGPQDVAAVAERHRLGLLRTRTENSPVSPRSAWSASDWLGWRCRACGRPDRDASRQFSRSGTGAALSDCWSVRC